jgi:hypothetical protein
LEPADPKSLERQVRQLLADKISGNQVGLWLLLPEHLRLGTWDLLCGWTGQTTPAVAPRLALQVVHEAALCTRSFRQDRSLSQKGFELAHGLPFVASDQAIHELLDAHTIAQAQQLQIALGKLRQASGHFQGRLLAIDPHRLHSYTQRQMRRHRTDPRTRPFKAAQTFFCLDADTQQPLCFTIASAARTVAQASPELLGLAGAILPQSDRRPLALADCEHFDHDLLRQVRCLPFDWLIPMPQRKELAQKCAALPADRFTTHWPGYATAQQPYHLSADPDHLYYQFIERACERTEDFYYKSFLCTVNHPALPLLSRDYPDRWHVEEFFKFNQSLGWQRAGTLNLNIRYGQMTLALLAQSVLHQLRQRLGEPFRSWDADHFARHLFGGLEGDVRVEHDTIVVTYYNAPNAELLKPQYQDLPQKLREDGIAPEIPWLYNFKLDFRFK